MKNILYLIHTTEIGGAEKICLTIARRMKDKYNILVGLLKEGWLFNELKNSRIATKIIPSGRAFDLKLIFSLIEIIKNNKIDIVHSHLLDMNFYSSVASRITGVPHIATEHGDIYSEPDKKLLIKARVLSWLSDRIVFVSEFSRKAFFKISPAYARKAVVIYNGVDLKEYEIPVDIKRKRAEIGIKEDEVVIGNVGNLHSFRKGHVYMLRAAQKILKIFPKSVFIIIGGGESEEALKKEADNLGITEKVKFLGFRYDVKDLIKIMDIFVLPSLNEALPVTIIEAMVNRIPVVSTNVGGIPELIEDGIDGLLIPPADSDALANKIIHLLKNNDLAHKLVESGYEKAKELFNMEFMMNKYEKLYLNLLGKN